MALGNVGDMFGKIPRLVLADRFSLDADFSRFQPVESQKAVNQRGFTASIRADDAQNLSFFHLKVNMFEDHSLSIVAECRVFYFH